MIRRFSVLWKKDELFEKFKDYFDLIEFKRAEFKGRIFLEAFYRKKSDS